MSRPVESPNAARAEVLLADNPLAAGWEAREANPPPSRARVTGRSTDRTPDDVILAGVGGGIAGFLFALIVVGVVRVFG